MFGSKPHYTTTPCKKLPRKVTLRLRWVGGMPAWRNKVVAYPCGILEQAYRELRGRGAVATSP